MTNKIILSSITSLLLLNTLSAKDLLKEYTCGQHIHTNDKENYSCKRIQIEQIVEEKIVEIKDFKRLFSTIDIDTFQNLYQNKKNQKLLNNNNINAYTHTYLLYKKVINFKDILNDHLQVKDDIQNNFIQEVHLGGEFIALIHIKTDSKDAYMKIKKLISKKLLLPSHIDDFQEQLINIQKKYKIQIKEYTSNDLEIQVTDEINTLFHNYKNFETYIQGKDSPIAFTYYHDMHDILAPMLNLYYSKNNLNYIKKHPEEFILLDSINNYAKKYDKLDQQLLHIAMHKETNTTVNISLPSLPMRHNASLNINNIQTLPFSYTIKEQNVKATYPRIDKNINFSLLLQIREDIKRDGKVVIETTELSIKANNKQIATEKNSHIKVDTYVNYPKLLFSRINNNSLGSLKGNFIFDKYEQEKKIQGFGLINEAICGYKVKYKTNKLHFYCKEIILKPLNIKFKHKEIK